MNAIRHVSRYRFSILSASSAVLAMLCGVSFAQVASDGQAEKPIADKVSLEVFEGPQIQNEPLPPYPKAALMDGVEGWVEVGYMIDKKGKPFELTVTRASGQNKELHKVALNAVKNWSYVPASIGGEAVDSAFSRKLVFRIDNNEKAANPDFASAYRKFVRAMKETDRTAVEVAMSRMKVKNLYEDAYYGLVQFYHAETWGTPEQQLAGIRRAVAGEERATYLPKELFASALQQQFKLELKLQDFQSALFTWKTMHRAGIDKSVLDGFKPVVEQLRLLRKDARTYKVAGQLTDGSWNYLLFKNKFRIDVTDGRISQIKLRCARNYVFFQFDPSVEYTTSEKHGTCGLEAVGDADTKFELVQM